VKAEDLGAGLYLDPKLHALVDKGRGRAFRIGDEVEVEVLNASPARRQIDLALVEGGRAVRAPRDARRDDGRRDGRRGERGGGDFPREKRGGLREERPKERKGKRRRDR
jgi:hypothetical protein